MNSYLPELSEMQIEHPWLLGRMLIVGGILTMVYFYLVSFLASLFVTTASFGVGLVVSVLGTVLVMVVSYLIGVHTLTSDAEKLSRSEFPRIHQRVEELCEQLDIEKPTLLIDREKPPNALALGRRRNGYVLIHSSLIELLDDEELDNILAHELAHLDNRDSIVMTISSKIVDLVNRLTFWMMYLLALVMVQLKARNRRNVNTAYLRNKVKRRAMHAAGLIAFFIALFHLALSRHREYIADVQAAQTTGQPEKMCQSLTKIENVYEQNDFEETFDDGVPSSLYFMGEVSGFLNGITSDHPPMEKRRQKIRSSVTSD